MTHLNAPSIEESGFEVFGLANTILTSVKNEGFTVPTKIQLMAIPPLMDGNDLIGIAQTGGGKTAAFALPIINKLLENYERPRPNRPKVLILAPTRELAMQIEQCIIIFSKGTKLRSLVVAGGQPYPPQTSKLRSGVDILVATPGRLIDHINRNNVKFADTTTYILDEADRMLDMGFIDDVQDISNALPENHQTILFSATMNAKVRNLSRDLLNDPVNVEILSDTVVADTITHKLMNVSRKNKTQLLSEILLRDNVEKVLVFARTKLGADKLSDALHEKGIQSDAIHGDKRQRVREKILMNFRRGRIRVLVATDVAARGIDVDGISHVVNYELPIEPENYIHRVGRTGRAGATGIAISFCDASDMRLLVHIERMLKQPIEVDMDHAFHIDLTSRGAKAGGGSKGRFSRNYNGRSGGGFNRSGSEGNSRGFRKNRDGRSDGGAYRSPRIEGAENRAPRSADGFSRARNDGGDYRGEGRPALRDEGGFNRDNRGEGRPALRGEGGFNRDNRGEGRPALRGDQSRGAGKPWNKEGRGGSRGAHKFSKVANANQDIGARKAAKPYDPWANAKEYADDPVLGKLIGKSPKVDSKRKDKTSFVKSGNVKKKAYTNKKAEFTPKKSRGGKGVVTAAKGMDRENRIKAKDSGGNNIFSPKRKILRPSRAA